VDNVQLDWLLCDVATPKPYGVGCRSTRTRLHLSAPTPFPPHTYLSDQLHVEAAACRVVGGVYRVLNRQGHLARGHKGPSLAVDVGEAPEGALEEGALGAADAPKMSMGCRFVSFCSHYILSFA